MYKLLFAALLFTIQAHAADDDTARLKDRLQKDYASLLGPIQQVNRSPIAGLYEVVTQNQILYVEESGRYLISGALIDLTAKRNLTEERARKLFAIDFNRLPLELAVKKVKGKGTRRLAYFSDPNCGYCKKLEQELKQIDDVTLYIFLYPIFNGSEEKARGVWCSKDRVRTWDDLMQNGKLPPPGQCTADNLAKIKELGGRLRVTGTPALIFADGTLVPGYMPAAELDLALNNAAR